jgi:crossover junction endodeoxyribonuclease RusA
MQRNEERRGVKLTLPWPPAGLSPNARHAHWSTLAREKKRFRNACAMTARQQGAAKLEADRIAVSLRFVPPDRRARDLDNCIAAMKSGLDGLADVIGVDDSRWELAAAIAAGEVGGMVKVEVTPCQQES